MRIIPELINISDDNLQTYVIRKNSCDIKINKNKKNDHKIVEKDDRITCAFKK